MMFYKKYDDPNKVKAIHELLKYCLTEGQKIQPINLAISRCPRMWWSRWKRLRKISNKI